MFVDLILMTIMPRSKPTAKPNNKLSDLAAKLSNLRNDINKLESKFHSLLWILNAETWL